MNTLLVGATGYLGSYLCQFDPVIATTRFEDHEQDWQQYKNIDRVWLVARACRKTEPRRDMDTFLLETQGVANICRAFPNAHIVYTSTKVVYGLTDDSIMGVSRATIAEHMLNPRGGTYDLPARWFQEKSIERLATHHQWYAETKLVCEGLVRSRPMHTILRIWDIVK